MCGGSGGGGGGDGGGGGGDGALIGIRYKGRTKHGLFKVCNKCMCVYMYVTFICHSNASSSSSLL